MEQSMPGCARNVDVNNVYQLGENGTRREMRSAEMGTREVPIICPLNMAHTNHTSEDASVTNVRLPMPQNKELTGNVSSKFCLCRLGYGA